MILKYIPNIHSKKYINNQEIGKNELHNKKPYCSKHTEHDQLARSINSRTLK